VRELRRTVQADASGRGHGSSTIRSLALPRLTRSNILTPTAGAPNRAPVLVLGGQVAETRSTSNLNTLDDAREARRAEARAAVADTFARILEERYPGSRWLPRLGPDRDASSGPAERMTVLTTPDDPDPLGDVVPAAADATNVDHVDR
jgi:hypothetical protein